LSIDAGEVAPLAEYSVSAKFELIVLATKAQGAIDVVPSLVRPLAPGDSASGLEPGSTTDACKSARERMRARRALKPRRHHAEAWDVRATQCRLSSDRRAWRGRKRAKRTGAPVAQSCSKCKSNSKSSRGCLVQAPAQLLGYHAGSDCGPDHA